MGIAGNIFGPPGGRDHTEASSVLRAEASDNFLVIPNGDFVLEAGYERLGPDLLLSDKAAESNGKPYTERSRLLEKNLIRGSRGHRL